MTCLLKCRSYFVADDFGGATITEILGKLCVLIFCATLIEVFIFKIFLQTQKKVLQMRLSRTSLFKRTSNLILRFVDGNPAGIRLYWWRAIENGAAVIQNESSGQLVIIANRDKRLTSAAVTVLKCLDIMRSLVVLKQQNNAESISGSQVDSPGAALISLDPQYPLRVPPTMQTMINAGELLSISLSLK